MWCLQYFDLVIPWAPHPNESVLPDLATHFQGETLDLVITNNFSASNNSTSNSQLCFHYFLYF